jgi:hypothetical protein
MLGKELMAALAVGGVAQGLLYVEVVAPAWEFDAIVTPLGGFLGNDRQRQVGPLAGE